MLFSGCITKSAYRISDRENLSPYKYIVLAPLAGDGAEDEALEKALAAVYGDAGLTVLKEGRGMGGAEENGASKILLAEYEWENRSLESVVSIFYSDFHTHGEVAYCRGTWGLKREEKNRELARENAVDQTRYLFGLGDEWGEYNKYSWY